MQENLIKIIYVIGFLFLLILLIRTIFKKGEIHFKLIKYLHPDKFEDTKSIYNLLFNFKIFRLDISSIIWLWTPV